MIAPNTKSGRKIPPVKFIHTCFYTKQFKIIALTTDVCKKKPDKSKRNPSCFLIKTKEANFVWFGHQAA
jgi:hypothetical protein